MRGDTRGSFMSCWIMDVRACMGGSGLDIRMICIGFSGFGMGSFDTLLCCWGYGLRGLRHVRFVMSYGFRYGELSLRDG